MTERFDPLRASTEIVEGYRRYLRALLPLRDPVLRAALDRAIDTSPLLSKGPLLEASPAYATGSTIHKLIDDGVLNRRFLDPDRARATCRPASVPPPGGRDPQGTGGPKRGRRDRNRLG
jgi:hypothetical protein